MSEENRKKKLPKPPPFKMKVKANPKSTPQDTVTRILQMEGLLHDDEVGAVSAAMHYARPSYELEDAGSAPRKENLGQSAFLPEPSLPSEPNPPLLPAKPHGGQASDTGNPAAGRYFESPDELEAMEDEIRLYTPDVREKETVVTAAPSPAVALSEERETVKEPEPVPVSTPVPVPESVPEPASVLPAVKEDVQETDVEPAFISPFGQSEDEPEPEPPPAAVISRSRLPAAAPRTEVRPIRMKREVTLADRKEFKAGLGKEVFYGSPGSEIILKIGDGGDDWRLLLSSFENLSLDVEEGQMVRLPPDMDFCAGVLYDNKENLLSMALDDEFAFSGNTRDWSLFYLSLKEVPLRSLSSYDLAGRSGILLGPDASSLTFFNAGSLQIDRKESGNYTAPDYGSPPAPDGASASQDGYFVFSVYHENAYFSGYEDMDTVCLEVEGGSTYGWNVSFENGLFMSVADIVEYQHRNGVLPDSSGILYHGANRLEFTGIRSLVVYSKPFYYGYGVA